MDNFDHDLEHPKKRRRREVEARPLAARLLFDDTVKGDAALVSQSLWSRLTGDRRGMLKTCILRLLVLNNIMQTISLQPRPRSSH